MNTTTLISIAAAIGLTVLSWGVYGAVLHKGQEAMEGTRLRPLICVGLAYFVITVVLPLIAVYVLNWESSVTRKVKTTEEQTVLVDGREERQSVEVEKETVVPVEWTPVGFWLSLAGGAAGAIGAIGIVLALSSGGSPTYVMPLVFGGAPVVNAVVTLLIQQRLGQVLDRPLFLVGLVTVIVGAMLVMTNTPPPQKHGGPATAPAGAQSSSPAH